MKIIRWIPHYLFLLFLFIACSTPPAVTSNEDLLVSTVGNAQIDLAELPLNDVKTSGRKLMNLPNGLHWISSPNPPTKKAITIFVHGYESKGYEWIYAIHRASAYGKVGFYRWNWNSCPTPQAQRLSEVLHASISAKNSSLFENSSSFRLIGHSYGGVLVSHTAPLIKYKVDIHTVAAPLRGYEALTKRCGPVVTPNTLPSQISHTQWRTQFTLDGAFKSWPQDPQIFSIKRGVAWRLPKQYRGRRLGHNWSVSWVVDELFPQSTPADSTTTLDTDRQAAVAE